MEPEQLKTTLREVLDEKFGNARPEQLANLGALIAEVKAQNERYDVMVDRYDRQTEALAECMNRLDDLEKTHKELQEARETARPLLVFLSKKFPEWRQPVDKTTEPAQNET